MAAKKKASTAKKSTAKSKSEAAKKAAETRKKNAEKRRAQAEAAERKKKITKEVLLWVGVAFAALLFLSNFGIIGPVGDGLKSVMLGLFGVMGYLFPIVLIIVALYVMFNKKSGALMTRVMGIIVLFIDLCLFSHLIFKANDVSSILDTYTDCSAGEAGGGIVGGVLGIVLYNGLGMAGAVIIAIVLLVVAIVLLSQKSISGYLKRRGESAREAALEARERREAEREEVRAAKEANRAAKRAEAIDARKHDVVPDEPVKADDPITQNEVPFKIDGVDVIDDTDFEQDDTVFDVPVDTPEPEAEKPEPVESEHATDGEFEPSERIDVSDEAKETMARKPFDTSGPKVDPETGEILEEKEEKVEKASNEGKIIAPKNKVLKYKKPPYTLLEDNEQGGAETTKAALMQTAYKLKEVLAQFGVNVEVSNVSRGPAVTRYELQPELGTKVSTITNLANDIKLNMAVTDIRIEAPIPGKAAIGIELPNEGRTNVYLKELLKTPELQNHKSNLAFPAGKDIAGKVVVADITKMPHMLIAGTTGSGKSVFTNSILMSILYRTTPNDVRVIIIDPKVVEFKVYNGIPHLLYDVVTDPKKAAGILNWAVMEMTTRYKKFANVGTRDIDGYNAKVKDGETDENGEPIEKMPHILIIIDELADLMMVAAKEVEDSIVRLAQLARAAGIHMIIATQRPSVDVITGLIKANIPSRAALTVASGTDSRTIIDMNGAEKLLGNGDMLFYPQGYVKPIRIQAAYVSEKEIKNTVDYIKKNSDSNDGAYKEEIDAKLTADQDVAQNGGDERDPVFADAGRLCIERDKGSTSMLQRQFRLGFNRAARIMDQLYDAGVVGQEETNKPRKVLMSMEEFEAMLNGDSGNNEE